MTVTVPATTVAMLMTELTVVSTVTVGGTVSMGSTVTKTVEMASHVVFPLSEPARVSTRPRNAELVRSA